MQNEREKKQMRREELKKKAFQMPFSSITCDNTKHWNSFGKNKSNNILTSRQTKNDKRCIQWGLLMFSVQNYLFFRDDMVSKCCFCMLLTEIHFCLEVSIFPTHLGMTVYYLQTEEGTILVAHK